MNVTEIKRRLTKLGLRPTRDRGQNFLLDESVADDIVLAAGVSEGDRVLEIGPGLGMLTAALLSRGSRVLAVELDRALAGLLAAEIISDRLALQIGDFLTLNDRDLATGLGTDTDGDCKVVANLPYSITSEALTRLLSMSPRPSSLTLMVQREVAERICARPPKVGILTVLVGLHGEPRIVRTVSPGSFWPRPKVESAVLQVGLRSRDEVRRKLSGPRACLKSYLPDRLGSVPAANDSGLLAVDTATPRRPSAFSPRTGSRWSESRTASARANETGEGDVRRPRTAEPPERPRKADLRQALTEERLMEIVRLGFSSRRKQLKNTLASRFPAEHLSAALTEADIDPSERPERLTVDMWIGLAAALTR